MNRTVLAAIVCALLPASAFAYIGSGFKSAAAYRQHLREEHAAKIGRATEAIRRDPKDAVAYFYRANLHAQLGGFTEGVPRDYEQALADYDKAIELDPKFTKAYFNRGQVRLRVHRFKRDEALADLEKASQLDPTFVEAHVVFAENTEDIAKAIEAVKRACEYTEYKGEVCLELLASFYAKNGDFDNAIRWQEKALKLEVHFGVDIAKKRLENYRMKKPNEWAIHSYWAKYEAQAVKKSRKNP